MKFRMYHYNSSWTHGINSNELFHGNREMENLGDKSTGKAHKDKNQNKTLFYFLFMQPNLEGLHSPDIPNFPRCH